MLPGLEEALKDCARQRITLTYGQMAERLEIDGPRRIAKLTSVLETLMEQDAKTLQPLRAALVVGRGTDGLPARGFFQKAQALGLCEYPISPTRAQEFHARQLKDLFAGTRTQI
ncbi:hypothetical protein [Roseinatronobacter sp. S2]|uniref:hypothetical protein n=1 Tax=Roseinatronobacter sp. S2 TaxID=3035471 RepID=UPI00240F76E8|nr:hypothetical protein [Roseinatronobacter sp. S2]WFE74527.1 hypothetical protein P8S53_15240 [Roseinatronobacter sp. S2]